MLTVFGNIVIYYLYFRQVGCVLPCVCLSFLMFSFLCVSLLATSRKTKLDIHENISRHVGPICGRRRTAYILPFIIIPFWIRIQEVLKDSSTLQHTAFSTLGLICTIAGETDRMFMKILTDMYLRTRKFREILKSRGSGHVDPSEPRVQDPDLDSNPPWWRSSFSECSFLF